MPRRLRITTLEELGQAAQDRKAVICTDVHSFRKPTSASFVLGQHGTVLMRLFAAGLYIYEKPITEGA